MEDEQRLGTTRYRVYSIVGIVVGLLFLALAVAAFLGGGGVIVAAIAAVGGLVVLVVSIVNLVRA